MDVDAPLESRAGTQVVARVGAVLRAVSAHAPAPISTSEVAAATRLTRPTAHWLLSALAAEGFEIDKRMIILEEPLRNIGVFTVPVKIHSQVEASAKVYVIQA